MRIIIFCLIFLCTAGCHKEAPSEEKKPLVLVSLPPYAFLVEKLAHEFVEIDLLIPEGVNPHTYEAPAKTIKKHKQADLWIYAGELFDQKFKQFLHDSHAETTIIDIMEGIDPIYAGCSCHQDVDRHVWLSPRAMLHTLEHVTEQLTLLLPEQKEILQNRKRQISMRLQQVDNTIRLLFRQKRPSSLLTSHPAFAYFCRDYGIEQLCVEVDGKEPRFADVQALVERAKIARATSMIIQPQHSSKGAQAVASHLELPVHTIDPYAKDYDAMILQLAQVLCP